MGSFRLIAVDVDGTLLTSKGGISPRTRSALLAAVEKGVHVAVATGRRRRSAKPILERLDVPYFLVASQGAAVWRDDHVLFHSHLPAQNARAALGVIREHGLATVILGNALREDEVWVDGDWPASPRLNAYVSRLQAAYHQEIRPVGRETFDHDVIELIVVDEIERLAALDQALTGHTPPPPSEDAPAEPGPAGRQPLWRAIFSKNQFTAGGAIEVVGPDTSKAAALAFLCQRLDISRDQVIAFGDNVNDLEMLAFAGTGVAMGNATADALAAANLVAPTNDEDGIAVTLEGLGIV